MMSFIKSRSLLYLALILLTGLIACDKESEKEVLEPKFESFTLRPEFNSGLNEVVVGDRSGIEIKLTVPYNVSLNNLVVSFNYVGVKVEVNGVEQISNVTANDFSQPVTYTVFGINSEPREYTVTITKKLPQLPQVYVEVEGRQEYRDDEKETYKKITLKVMDPDNLYTSTTEFNAIGEMKGRGNSTWYGVPKKPYRIKLDEKSSLLSMSTDKNWALLANFYDKTLLRNLTAFEISKIVEMPWTPKSVSVDYYMNGTYRGVYTLTEHVRVSDERVNLNIVSQNDNSGDAVTGDYFLELDFHYDEPYRFRTNKKNLPIMFKDPEEPTTNQFNYVENFFNMAEEVLYSENFTDPVEGYRKYIDVPSFINYYIVQELAKNVDGNLRGSCYMALRKKGKIEFPLVWDFDLAFGNADHITWEQGATSSEWDGWFIKTQSPWFDRLFQDPQFVNELKSRWNELKPKLNMIPDFIKEHAHLLNDSQKRNFSPKPIGAGWSITDQQWNTSKIRGSYEKEVEYLINFVEKRLEWLDTNINALK
jgi:spore coat protein CotH